MIESAALSEDAGSDAAAGDLARGAALQHRPWRSRRGLSSVLGAVERFLGAAGFERGPWLAVAFAAGIIAWFALPGAWQWLALLAGCLGSVIASLAAFAPAGRFAYLRQALASVGLLIAAGCLTVWLKSTLVGARPIERPIVAELTGVVLDREPQPAQQRVRLLLATHEPGSDRPIRVRVTLPLEQDRDALGENARVRVRARLMPPAPPMLPGAYDFARTAWFAGISATGSVLGQVTVLSPGDNGGWLERVQARLSQHVRERLRGSAGAIAAAFARAANATSTSPVTAKRPGMIRSARSPQSRSAEPIPARASS